MDASHNENNIRITKWINTILEEASKLENNKGIALLHACGTSCSELSLLLEGATKINQDYSSEENNDTIFNAFKKEYYNNSKLIKEKNKITLIFEECTCPLVKEGITNEYLCNCTIGFTIKIFKTLFNKKVEVDLEQSILKGNPICKQLIRICD